MSKARAPRPGGPGKRPLSDLADGNRGTRQIGEAAATALGHSLAEFGDLSGLVANVAGDGWELVAGHQRLAQLRAAGASGWTLVQAPAADRDGAGYVEHPTTRARFPVRLVAWDAAKAAAARYTANNLEIAGEFTSIALAELQGLADAPLPHFDDLGLEALLGELRETWPATGGNDNDPGGGGASAGAFLLPPVAGHVSRSSPSSGSRPIGRAAGRGRV